MSTSAAGILPVSSGAPVPSSGPAAPTLPPTKAKRNALVEQAKYIDACDLMMTISPDSVGVLRQFYKDDEQWGQIVKRFREAAENDTSQLKHKTNWSQEIGPAHQRLDGQVRPGYQTPDAARRSCSLVTPPQNQCSSRARASEKHQSDAVEPAEATPTPPAVPPVTPNAVAYVSWRIYALEFTFLSQRAASGPPLTPDAVAMRFFFVFCNDVPASTRSHWLVARTKLFLLSMLRLLYCLSVLRLMFVILITLILFSAVFDTHMLLGVLYL
ncbi:hypothetical protein FB451DRAFT_1417345 [Mycena latifolia]|nr:hypothetical protein FB451DRAFT_1417345 [Mycena latifolia]